MAIQLYNPALTSTLFLDRDGVINHEKPNDYVHHWDEFVFYDGVKKAMQIFAPRFTYIFIVTNQRGVGKGLTTLPNLQHIHQQLTNEVTAAGGRIDRIYFCPDVDNDSVNRKPQIGMALKAKQDFPAVDFSNAVMVGNTPGDMQFGRNIGAATVFLPTTRPDISIEDPRVDAIYPSLLDFAHSLCN